MAKNKISEYSATSADNTDISNINIAEGCSPANLNNAIRTVMAQLKDQQAGTSGDPFTVGGNLTVTGTSTLTGNVTAPTQSSSDNSTKVATTAFVQAGLALLYPIGSIYSSTVSTNPNTLFGFGTWVAYGAGRVLIGNGGGFTAGATGGSADAITVAHTHTGTTNSTSLTGSASYISEDWNNNGTATGIFSKATGFSSNATPGSVDTNNTGQLNINATHTHTITTDSTGASGTNANLQPYVVVYMWNRTA
jgi:hypothetical protein